MPSFSQTTTEAEVTTKVQLTPAPQRENVQFQDLVIGDREGKLQLQGIPTFTDPYKQRQWMKEHMAAAFRFFAKNGYAEGIAGHISMRGMFG